MIYSASGFSESGPRAVNEDGFAFWWFEDIFFAAVADGLGGLGGGGDASKYVLDFLKERTAIKNVDLGDLPGIVLDAHMGLRHLQQEQPQNRSMATTLTFLAIKDERLVAAHCGDTRLYLARGNGIKRLSEDHSEGERLFKEGLISRKELFEYPRKHILESALGVPGEPRIQKIDFQLQSEDWLVIASDGAYEKLSTAEMRDIGKVAATSDEFVSACRDLIKERIPSDNFTMLAVRVMSSAATKGTEVINRHAPTRSGNKGDGDN